MSLIDRHPSLTAWGADSQSQTRRPTRVDQPRADRSLDSADRPRGALPWIAASVLFAVYAALSVQRHLQHMTSGFDLGIFEQEVASYAHGHLPTSSLKGPAYQLLGDHFSPIFAVLAPFYRLAPSPITLLVAQAVLLAVAVVPLTAWTQRAVGRGAAVVVAFGYGMSWGIAQTVGFDVHEVAFAVPLISGAAAALGQGRLRRAVLFAAPLVLVKEDLGLTVAVVGLLVAIRGERRLGLVTAAAGVLATWVEMSVIIPAFNPAGNGYTGQVTGSNGIVTQLHGLLTSDTRIATVVLVLAPTAFLAVRSPLLWLALPTLAWRFLSDNPAYWGTGYHYSAVLMPIVFAAFVDVLRKHPSHLRRWLTVSVLVTACLVPLNPISQLWSGSLWRHDPQVAATDQMISRIPSGVSVSASNWIAPQLTGRDDVSLFGGGAPIGVVRPDYIVVDTAEKLNFPINAEQQQALLAQAETDGYDIVDRAGSVVLLHRTSG